MRSCVDGKEHGAIVTADDDPEIYDATVFASAGFTPPNGHQWGYCGDCRQPFRWSVPHQRWMTWPGGVAALPQLTSEELESLEAALLQSAQLAKVRVVCHELRALITLHQNCNVNERVDLHLETEDVLKWIISVAIPEYDQIEQAGRHSAEPAASVVQSLLTAVREAQHHLWEPEDRPPAPLELWGWVGEDEFGSGEVGLKQAHVPAGRIPLVAIVRPKIDAGYIRDQLLAQVRAYGKAIRLARFREVPYTDPVELR